ncbi:KH homology domain-containing protein 4 [Eumeta japonica]|uniref:KH homology domain-containing protein 4 n=1 Tax=Eumeta variegata TaxID=151549 RepID=A0A4C1SXT7_EUMVA|nr:KH homology domain-containing protein 4 [Eumeta japonica]
MSGGLIDKVYIGLDSAPAAFDIRNRILGANGTNLEYIRSETGVVAVLKGDKFEPLHLALHHTRSEALAAARSLALNLIETIRAELSQWTATQTGGPPPTMNVPPPTLTTTSTPQPVPPPVATVTLPTQTSLTSTAHSSVLPPVVSVAPASTPLMTVRQPAVLQLLPQQQYVLNQENGQLIPIVQPGVQVSNSNFTSLPIAQSQLHTLQQPSFGTTQIVDISNVQPLNVTQLRLSGVPSSMSMILPNGLTFSQGNITATSDTTTVSTATSTPVVCAAPGVNSSQKILYSADKSDKQDVKYHIQGTETVQWTVPGSQTMIIPYQQLQDFSANSQGLANIQPQQFVSIIHRRVKSGHIGGQVVFGVDIWNPLHHPTRSTSSSSLSSRPLPLDHIPIPSEKGSSALVTPLDVCVYVHIAPAGGLPATSLPLSAAQWQQLQATGTIMQFNQKPTASSAPLINIISTGQASSPQPISLLHKNENADQLGYVSSNGIGGNQKGLCQVKTAGGVELPIEAFPDDVDAWLGLPHDFLRFGLS